MKWCNQKNLSRSTVQGWLKDENKLKDNLADKSVSKAVKTVRESNYKQVEDELYDWYSNFMDSDCNTPIDFSMMKFKVK